MHLGVAQSVLQRSIIALVALSILSLFLVPSAHAFELFDGRFQAHGFFESQLRVLNEDFSEDWDVAQWYQVLDVELELDLIDDTFMGIDLLSAFVRLEVRYDCVYTHGCGTFRSINAYGDGAKSLPRRLSNGNDEDVAGVLFIEELERLSGDNTDPVLLQDVSGFRIIAETEGQTIYTPKRYTGAPGVVDRNGNPLIEDRATLGNESDPFPETFGKLMKPELGSACDNEDSRFFNCFVGPTPFSLNFKDFKDHKFTQIKTRTGAISRMGPWLPKNNVNPIASMSGIPNPFDSAAKNEVLFVGYLDNEGFPTDHPTNGTEALNAIFQTDPTVAVKINLTFPEAAGTDISLRMPLLRAPDDVSLVLNKTVASGNPLFDTALFLNEQDADRIDYTLDANGLGTSKNSPTLNYPKLGVVGSGAKPYRPTSIVDNDEAFYFGPDVKDIELNIDCKSTSDGGSSCYVREVDSTIVYDSANKISDIGDFNINFQKYYRDLQVSLRTVCQPGEMGCFERVFTEEMDREGFDVSCPPGEACAGASLSSVIEEAFKKIDALDCLETEWDCSDQLLTSAKASLADLKAQGALLTCDAGMDCETDISKYLVRFGTRYVISATRSDNVARGNFIPSRPLKELLGSGRLADFPFNFSESQRAWNRGQSQNDEKELKEAYLDIELMDSRLWLRVGKQSIVWGKTELFRTTDQFNPQDFALSSLGSLEETRINLWAFRGVYSLYEVGPLSDVRVELAFNFDDFQASDFGACGEAFTPNVVCQLTLGALVHGMTGVGIAGIVTPPYRWFDPRGWELGGRVEWRWDRFSFALTDFWGYNDLPTLEFITQFQRNVDPFSGRPRRLGFGGPCGTDDQDVITQRSVTGSDPLDVLNSNAQGFIDAIIADGSGVLARYQDGGGIPESCLRPGPTHREFHLADLPKNADLSDLTSAALRELREVPGVNNPAGQRLPVNNSYRAFIEGNALDEHHANLNFFTWVCSSTVGFLTLDPNACAQTVFGSQVDVGGIGPLSLTIGKILGGQPAVNHQLTLPSGKTSDFLPVALPIVTLHAFDNQDPTNPSPTEILARREGKNFDCFDPNHEGPNFDPATFDPNGTGRITGSVGCGLADGQLSGRFTPEQEALLGCGPFFGTNCDFSGLDLLNADASALYQSFAGIEGTLKAVGIFEQQLKAVGRDDIDVYFRTDGWLPLLGREMNKEGTALLIDDPRIAPMLQPGTVRWRQAGIDTPVCTSNHLAGRTKVEFGRTITASDRLPGCRGLTDFSKGDGGQTAFDKVTQHFNSLSDSTQFGANGALRPGHDFFAAGGDSGYFIDPSFFMFHPYVADADAQRDSNGVIIDTNNDGVPDIKYPGVKCSPDLGSSCHASLKDFADRPEYHNQWDPGYDINFDGTPFKLRLKSRGSSRNLKLQGQLDGSDIETVTPNGPSAFFASMRTDFASGGGLAAGQQQLGSGQPFTGDIFTSEMAGFSYNFMMMLVAFDEDFQLILDTITAGPFGVSSVLPVEIGESFAAPYDPSAGKFGACLDSIRVNTNKPTQDRLANDSICKIERRRFAVHYAFSGDEWGTHDPNETFPDQWLITNGDSVTNLTYQYVENRFVGMEILKGDSVLGSGEFIEAGAHCSFITPQNCGIIQNLFAIAGVQHRSVKAGGNGEFGRRTFIWHSGGEVVLRFDRRNVLGLAVDFAEDYTKSNWGMEFTWVEGVRVSDFDEFDGLATVNDFNLTISMDRPTFINFLNPNHTFFLNTQWFIQYRDGYKKSMPANGPLNVLGLVFIQTGYFQDRLLPGVIGVYDFLSRSGAALPQVTFRYSENFSVVVGANIFMGREQLHEMPLAGIAPASNQQGKYAYQVGVENGIALVRDRDEVFLRLRYTF